MKQPATIEREKRSADSGAAPCSADPTDDPAYQAFVEEMAKLCRCSHDQPCDGLLAGGMCDNLQWSNDDDWREDEDE